MKRKKPVLGVLLAAALTIVHLPGSEADAATSASDFKMEGSTLVKYQGKDKNVTIPGTVERIGRGAFEENKNIEQVTIPGSVEDIEPYAFWGCDNLESITIGKGLDRVGDYAFSNCISLKNMVLPSNVTSIGIRAFEDCADLTDITIPPQTSDIHETAFEGCSSLTIHYEEGSAAEEYAQNFYERQKDMTGYDERQRNASTEVTPITSAEPTHQPTSAPADSNSQPTAAPTESATQPTAAPTESAAQPTAVPTESASQPTVVPTESAAQPTAAPTESAPQPTFVPMETPVPASQQSGQVTGNELGNTLVVGNRAVVMINNTRLPVFGGEIPAVSAIEQGQTLQNADIPKYTIIDGKAVADQAYYRSPVLGDVVLPQGIQEIGEFSYARSSATSAVLPEGLEHIGYGAFYHCDSLQTVVLPETIRCVEPKAFSYTKWVQDFLEGEPASEQDNFLMTGGVLAAYRGNAADVTIPEGVRVIAGEVFRNHTEIEKVSLPDSLLVVGEGAFEGCGSLSRIELGNGVQEIKDRAFLGNVMPEISLPSSVKKTGLQAFGNAVVSWEGEEAEHTYEPSATRLSNGAYRGVPNAEGQPSGVTVTGLEKLFGSSVPESFQTGQTALSGADRSYTLQITQPEDTAQMQAAYMRVFQTGIPQDMVIYGLTLTDESGIPLKKLGKQNLSVVLPVPEALKGRNLMLFTLDGNGQLEKLEVEALDVDGVEAFRFETNHPSVIGVCNAEATPD